MRTLIASLLAFGLSSSLVSAECARPAVPTLPDGSSADMAAMAAGQGEVKSFVADGNSYLECLQAEAAEQSKQKKKDQDPDAMKAADEARLASYNSMVEEMQAIAAEFNAEIKEFKARQ